MKDMFQANVIGEIHLFNLTIPLILKGKAKKVIAISTGFADIDLTADLELANSAPYSISKAALNMTVAKFSAQYAKDGVLFMTIAPGVVDTGGFAFGKSCFISHLTCSSFHSHPSPELELTETVTSDEQKQAVAEMFGKFQKYAPNFAGPSTAEVAVGQMISVMEKSSVEAGNGGTSVSQFGNKQWL